MHVMPKSIASCPNCMTMIPVTALAPLHRAARIDRMIISTYQSVSGAGQVGVHELDAQWTKLDGRSGELRRAVSSLRRQIEASPPGGLPKLARAALSLTDLVCLRALEEGDVATFRHSAETAVALREFTISANLLS